LRLCPVEGLGVPLKIEVGLILACAHADVEPGAKLGTGYPYAGFRHVLITVASLDAKIALKAPLNRLVNRKADRLGLV
jgi:hypothetical protein